MTDRSLLNLATARGSRLLSLSLCVAMLSACAVGPDFQQPTANAPANWNEWHNGSGLQLPQVRDQTLPANWWRAFNDPVLNQLIEQALHHSPDVHTAALHVAQARMQRRKDSTP